MWFFEGGKRVWVCLFLLQKNRAIAHVNADSSVGEVVDTGERDSAWTRLPQSGVLGSGGISFR